MTCICLPSDPKERNEHSARKAVKKVSDKMALALIEYGKLSKQFLKNNPRCVVFPDKPSVEVHHGKGRATIELLLDVTYFRPVSREGHNWIHNNPKEAIERGFSFSRLTEEPDPKNKMIHPCNCKEYNGGQCYNCLNGAHEFCDGGCKQKNDKHPYNCNKKLTPSINYDL